MLAVIKKVLVLVCEAIRQLILFKLYTFKHQQPQMINFASLFNQYRQQSSSGVNELLEQPNIKIGRLLEEDSFINEYKGNNPRVTQFMTYQRYLEVIEFLTVVPGPDDKKRAFKYPLAACDLLTIDCPNAIEYFFLPEEPIYIDQTVSEQVEVDVEVQIQDSHAEPECQAIANSGNNKQSSAGNHPAASPEKPENEGQEDEPTIQEPKEQPIKTEAESLGQKEKEDIQVLGEEEKAEQKQTLNTAAQSAESDIPKANKVHKIIKKELRTVEKVVKRQVPPLINNLLDYFRGEVNYTLAGYVSKVLSHFHTKKPTELLKYLLTEQMRELVLNHAESRSVGDLLVKILSHESTIFLEQRGSLFKSILKRMSVPSEVTIMSNLSAYVCQIVEKVAANLKSNNRIPDLNATFFCLDTVSTLISNVINPEESVSVYNAPMLLTYLTTVPFVLPEDQVVIDNFTQLLGQFVEKSCLKLNVQTSSHPKLGVGRVKIVEILRHIIKQDILKAREIIASKDNFFPTLYSLLVQYDLNNLLHNEIIRILEVALLEKEGSPLNQAVLKDERLLNLIVREAREDKKIRKGDSVYKSRKGYIAHIINLCVKLKELSQTNSAIKKLTENAQFEEIFQSLIEKQLYNTKKTLAGYAMRKDIKHEILFQKDDIIATHLTFFQKCPSPIFDQEPDHLASDHINIEHPDLLQELEKQLEQNMTVKTDQEKKTEKEGVPANGQEAVAEEVVVPAEVVSPAPNQYWVVHLQYSVDDLLADL